MAETIAFPFPEFKPMDKIARVFRDAVITEKIDGTNASILIGEDGSFFTGSRTRWITPADDNYGFARWAHENRDELMTLGPGHHFGEWWGAGIQRRYGQDKKIFSLFNVARWDSPDRPKCTSVVPTLRRGTFDTTEVRISLEDLRINGSIAAPGFKPAEGVVVWHEAGRFLMKATIERDEEHKGKIKTVEVS